MLLEMLAQLAGPDVGRRAALLCAFERFRVTTVPYDVHAELGVLLERLETASLWTLPTYIP